MAQGHDLLLLVRSSRVVVVLVRKQSGSQVEQVEQVEQADVGTLGMYQSTPAVR